VFTLPQDPSKASAEARANAEAARAAAKAEREAREWAATHNPDGSPKPQLTQKPVLTAKERADALQAYNDSFALERVLASLQRQFEAGPGATKGLAGIQDYFPTAANKKFDDTGQQARGYIKRSLGFTGGEGNTLGESSMLYDPFLPNTSDKDARILNKFDAIQQLAQDARTKSIAILGGVPDANGNVTPVDQNAPLPVSKTVAQGKTRNEFSPELSLKVDALMNAGASAAEINAMLAANQFPPLDQATYEDAKKWIASNPGKPYFGANINRQVDNTLIERGLGSPLGSAAISAANMGSFGGLQALAPDAVRMSGEANPTSAMLGGIAGSMTGTGALAKLGEGTLGRIAPFLMKGGKGAQFGRNLATDAAYGGLYGGVTEGDPLSGAGVAALGSAGGQAVGSLIGRGIGGVARTPAAQFLTDRGVKGLTTGQQLGGWVKGLEDRLSGLNIIGDQVNARRLEGFRDYNAAEFADAGSKIGFKPTGIADTGMQQLRDANSAAYKQALDPAQIDTLNDPQLVQDVAQARIAASQIPNVQPTMPRDYAEQSLMNRLQGPVDPNGIMSGRSFQESYRGLARDARSRVNSDYGHEIGQATRLGQDALAGALERQNPGAFAGFKAANETNRRISVLADAINRARKGGTTGEIDVFAPSQMIDAAAANAKKFPGGLDTTLAKNAQEVMPNKVPDSGTAGRMALSALALPAIFGGGGVAADQFGLTDDAAQRGLAIGALLALGGTKGGQAALNKALFDRPQALSQVGSLIRKHKGLFGSASVPLALEAGK
jgi:hypothetical protein